MFSERISGCCFLFLIILLKCHCHVFHTDKIYFSTFSDVTPFRKFALVSLSQCIYECKVRFRCDAINYSNIWKLCALISDPLNSTGDLMKGFVGGRKTDWAMASHTPCKVCTGDEVCTTSPNGSVICLKEECAFPPTLPYASTLGNIYTVGSNICYECQNGSVNIGGQIDCSTCSETGNWTDVNIQCELECSFPSTLPHATTLGNIYTLGSNVCYECQNGYVNVGGLNNCSTCSETGVWTDVNIQCDLECGIPPTIPNAITSGNMFTVGSYICYECQNGYVNVGGQNECSTCSQTGVWTDVNIQCELPLACGDTWVEHSGHCYIVYSTLTMWHEARSYCRHQGGYLLSIETAAENTFVEGIFPKNDYWIGGNDMAVDGVFVWDSGNALVFENWQSNEPNGKYSENCMRFDFDWKWRDKSCTSTLESICEKEL